MCPSYLDLELKLESLSKLKKDKELRLDEQMDDDIWKFEELLTKIKMYQLPMVRFWSTLNGKRITIPKRQEKSLKKVSRKVYCTEIIEALVPKLTDDLKKCNAHLECCHIQNDAFKKAQENAMSSNDITTVQIDWSKTVKLQQSKDEKLTYHTETLIGLLTIHLRQVEGNHSVVALSDCNDDKASAVMVNIFPLLTKLVEHGKTWIKIVSGSPSSQ